MTNLVEMHPFPLTKEQKMKVEHGGQELVLICDGEGVGRVAGGGSTTLWCFFCFFFFPKLLLFHYEYFCYLNINNFFLIV
jgi:hypothetical protein